MTQVSPESPKLELVIPDSLLLGHRARAWNSAELIVCFPTRTCPHLPTPSTAPNTQFQPDMCWLAESPLE